MLLSPTISVEFLKHVYSPECYAVSNLSTIIPLYFIPPKVLRLWDITYRLVYSMCLLISASPVISLKIMSLSSPMDIVNINDPGSRVFSLSEWDGRCESGPSNLFIECTLGYGIFNDFFRHSFNNIRKCLRIIRLLRPNILIQLTIVTNGTSTLFIPFYSCIVIDECQKFIGQVRFNKVLLIVLNAGRSV